MKKVIALTSGLLLVAFATPAFADENEIQVKNYNNATVMNEVMTSSNTGYNISNGGDSMNKVKGAGNTDNDASAGNGGDIKTGEATSWTVVSNTVNVNKNKIKTDCGCDGELKVKNVNNAMVGNGVSTYADTGFNITDAGNATNKIKGWNNDNNDSDSGNGGEITTGAASSGSEVVNVVNKNMTRIKRSGFPH